MSKFDNMTDERYDAALVEYIEKYQAPQPEPVEVLTIDLKK